MLAVGVGGGAIDAANIVLQIGIAGNDAETDLGGRVGFCIAQNVTCAEQRCAIDRGRSGVFLESESS